MSLKKYFTPPLAGVLSSSPIIQLNFASFLQLGSQTPFPRFFIFVPFTFTISCSPRENIYFTFHDTYIRISLIANIQYMDDDLN